MLLPLSGFHEAISSVYVLNLDLRSVLFEQKCLCQDLQYWEYQALGQIIVIREAAQNRLLASVLVKAKKVTYMTTYELNANRQNEIN